MLLTAKVIKAIGRLLYDPRKVYGVMIEAASERNQGSWILPRFQKLEQKEKEKGFL